MLPGQGGDQESVAGQAPVVIDPTMSLSGLGGDALVVSGKIHNASDVPDLIVGRPPVAIASFETANGLRHGLSNAQYVTGTLGQSDC
jgi:hypothetical protein